MTKQTETLGSFRLEILSNALMALTEEIQVTLLRSAYSQVVKEAQDASCAIFTAEGRVVAQQVVIPGHLGGAARLAARAFEGFRPQAAARWRSSQTKRRMLVAMLASPIFTRALARPIVRMKTRINPF